MFNFLKRNFGCEVISVLGFFNVLTGSVIVFSCSSGCFQQCIVLYNVSIEAITPLFFMLSHSMLFCREIFLSGWKSLEIYYLLVYVI